MRKQHFLRWLSGIWAVCLAVTGLPVLHVQGEALSVSAESCILMEAVTGEVLYEKAADQQRPMASTTKIMTTLLCLESGDLDTPFPVDNDAIHVEGSSMGLVDGDIVTKQALCYGMLLPSGNDAAGATAVKLAGSYAAFAEQMNRKAQELGMTQSHFVTPSGLHDAEHYSTARDMALLTAAALQNETFREICGQASAKVCFGNPPYERWLTNSNKLLTMDETVIGVKTGFTDEAGRCLVSASVRNGIMHPSRHISKTYRVTVRPDVTEEQLIALSGSMELDGKMTQPATVVVKTKEPGRVVLLMTIHEGKNRQIRRMCESVGLEVARLRRISIGPLKLGMLKPGTYRDLTAEELRAIRNAMGTGETAAPAKNKGRRR